MVVAKRLICKKKTYNNRGVAQLVARLVRDQEVMGSNPVTPTIEQRKRLVLKGLTFFFFYAQNNWHKSHDQGHVTRLMLTHNNRYSVAINCSLQIPRIKSDGI